MTDPAAPPEAAADAGFPSLRVAGYALAVFAVCYILYFIDIQPTALLVAPIKQAFGIDDTRFSLLLGDPSLIAILAVALPMGRLIDCGNRRNLLIAAALAWTVMNLLSAFAPGFWPFFILKVGVAMGGAWFYPTVVSLLADLFPRRQRTIAFTLLQLCGTGGVGLVLALGGGAIAHQLAGGPVPLLGRLDWWRWAFILVSVPGPLGAGAAAAPPDTRLIPVSTDQCSA